VLSLSLCFLPPNSWPQVIAMLREAGETIGDTDDISTPQVRRCFVFVFCVLCFVVLFSCAHVLCVVGDQTGSDCGGEISTGLLLVRQIPCRRPPVLHHAGMFVWFGLIVVFVVVASSECVCTFTTVRNRTIFDKATLCTHAISFLQDPTDARFTNSYDWFVRGVRR
jgi:hypothetical protein